MDSGTLRAWFLAAAVVAVVHALGVGRALAGTPSECEGYAHGAVSDFKKLRAVRCQKPGGLRWQASYKSHFAWCLAAPDYKRRREREARSRYLASCPIKPKLLYMS